MPDKLIVGSSPHITSHETTPKIMWSVFFALLPSGIAGVVFFGLSALKVIAVSVASCVISEALIQKLMHKEITIKDGSAALTGLLLAYNLSSAVPLWMPLVGGFFAIFVVKQLFGGLGRNIFNPALAARAFLMASWPAHMTNFAPPMCTWAGFVKPFSIDAVTQATPLTVFKDGGLAGLSEMHFSYWDLFIGNRGWCLGEVCILALLAGAAYLLWKQYIGWQAPLSFILAVGLLSYIFGGEGMLKGDFLFSILSGGLILGAFFMATDYVTTPLTGNGQLIFGIGCGLITFIIRRFGGYPEGVSYSILIMNAFVPLIDRYVKPRIYGTKIRN